MKLNNLKINGFGKISNKDIKIDDGINIIYGENESGKSTLLKFIIAMFYGITKNKNGGTIPEIEKYEPWGNNNEYSGKLSYKLDNDEEYEIYRDFKKKNSKIYNKNLEDITKKYNVDKTKGNLFFYDQVGIEEEIFTSSVITKQTEVKIDDKIQNTIIQKISNILGTGEDTNSYTNIINKLKKKINEEIGTANTKEKPINIIENKIEKLKKEKKELEEYQKYKFDIDDKISKVENTITEEKAKIEKFKKVKTEKEKLNEYESQIKINNELLINTDNEIENLESSNKLNSKNVINKISKANYIIEGIFISITLILLILVENKIFFISSLGITLIYSACLIMKIIKIKRDNKILNEKQTEINNKIKILEETKEKIEHSLEKIEQEYKNKIEKIQIENNIDNISLIANYVDTLQEKINSYLLMLHTLKIDNDNYMKKIEKLVNIEEELEILQEEKEELEYKRENIKRAITNLDVAYIKMKEQITPKFTKDLSLTMEKITNGKYTNVKINTEGKIIIENSNGEYLNIENLSIGTIDQIYLSLRIATINEITEENMPIILDETFAYYDEKRLENILQYLSKEYNEKQIIILTCTNREKEILKKFNIKYNYIEI